MAWGRRCAALAMAVLMVLVPLATTAGADHRTESDGDDLVAPLVENPQTDCTAWDGCPEELKGISYQDHDFGNFLEDADEENPPTYTFKSSAKPVLVSYNPIVAWEMCTYDGDHELLNCEHLEGHPGYAGEVDPDTEYIRVILRQGLANGYAIFLNL